MTGAGGTVAGEAAGLAARVRVARGAFALDVLDPGVEARPGEVLGVIGANGSGKSTLLAAIAGTLGIDAGEITLDGRVLTHAGAGAGGRGASADASAGTARVAIPRARRRVGMLDQRARFFPHLDARANIAFGPRAQGAHRREADELADRWLERVGLPGRGDAREGELSGGQQQRVAIARTLASSPGLLLLDEPFAALDVASSDELRRLLAAEVARLDVPVVLVTHDPIDLIALADRVVVLEAGLVAQHGTVAEVLGTPATPFAADFAGRTLLEGVSGGDGRVLFPGSPVPEVAGVASPLPAPGEPCAASFDPAEVDVAQLPVGIAERAASTGDRAAGAALRWRGTVSTVSASRTGVRIACAEWPAFVADLHVSQALALGVVAGDRVELSLPVDALRVAAR